MPAIATLVTSGLLLLCAPEALAETPGLQAQVARAVAHDLGIEVPGSSARLELQILGPEVRLPGQARLHVEAVHDLPGGGVYLLRMECGSRLECLPFEVVLRSHGDETGSTLVSPAKSSPVSSGNRATAPLVRAGQRVQLAEEVSGMRLSAVAVCLQSGGIGQRIRVRNVSSGRVVLARVRAAGQVAVED